VESVLKKKRKVTVGRICRRERFKPEIKERGGDGILIIISVGWAKKTGLFFGLDNFVTVSPRKACSMSKFSQFYREKGTKLAFQ